MTNQERFTIAALSSLIILQLVMLGALYAQSIPHPPAATPIFGIAPFLAASLSAAVAAIIVGPTATTPGKALSLIATVCALVSYGPQKFIDPNFPLIWPSVVTGQLAALTIIWMVTRSGKRNALTASA